MERILVNETVARPNESVKVAGWVHARRNHGKLIFIDLRDRSGLLQVVFNPKEKNAYEVAERLRPEWVIEIIGTVKERPQGMQNPNIATGTVELSATDIRVFSEAKTLPFPIDTDGYEINEDMRLLY